MRGNEGLDQALGGVQMLEFPIPMRGNEAWNDVGLPVQVLVVPDPHEG